MTAALVFLVAITGGTAAGMLAGWVFDRLWPRP